MDEKIIDITLPIEEYNRLTKDRLDFGFDSIYFRYAEVRDQLAAEKAMSQHTSYQDEMRRAKQDKMRFYLALEQLVQAHEVYKD